MSSASAGARVDAELRRLVRVGRLSEDEAAAINAAVVADAADAGRLRTSTEAPEGARGAVLEALGYIGGALVLGAIIFLGFAVWDDLGVLGRNLLAIFSVVVPMAGGLTLLLTRARRHLGTVLLALSCCALGFLWFNLFSDDTGIGSALVVVLASVVGAALLRHGAFLVSFAAGGALLVGATVLNRLAEEQWTQVPLALGIGYLLLAGILAAAGFLLVRTLAWSLAGLAGWAAAWCWFGAESGEVAALLVAAVVAGLLLFAFVRTRRYALAVIGCLVLLSVWPAALYQLVSSAYGVAIGLIAAGAVLIAVVVVLSRRHREGPGPAVITVHHGSD